VLWESGDIAHAFLILRLLIEVCGQHHVPAVLPLGNSLTRTEGLMGPREYLNAVAKRKISAPTGNRSKVIKFSSG
jgi:hypothetical protein